MISELYRQLEALAVGEFGDIVEDSELISSYTGRVRKLRIKLIDQPSWMFGTQPRAIIHFIGSKVCCETASIATQCKGAFHDTRND